MTMMNVTLIYLRPYHDYGQDQGTDEDSEVEFTWVGYREELFFKYIQK